ncbi:PTS transporter subunit EIIC [Lactiplantibacillus plantarum]|uniref:PTS sugar transporter subunit IIC n=1 Tax=Lactiplantibacillus plantarum TaxID=1590 RepID=UPI001CFF21FD|nr:PTS transporter subunit EIIC [Lactiplantibacillus plantarum]GJI51893.1 PTS sugar transporter subunit IIC [Lactiplantibacillus plantarum]
MERFFNSKLMVGLQRAGQGLGNNKFITALQAAMMSLMGILMVGAIFQITMSVLGPTIFGVLSAKSILLAYLKIPFQFSMNSLSIWVVLFLGFHYAKNLKMTATIMNAIDALFGFWIVAGGLIVSKTGTVSIDTTYLGAQGMFIGFVVVWISVRVEKLCTDKNIRINMPDAVPQFLQDGFASIVPLLFNAVIFLGASLLVTVGTAGKYNICSGFMELLAIPLSALTSTIGIFFLCILGALLWTFGIHGTMILVPIVMPLVIQAVSENAALQAAGKPVVFAPVMLFSFMTVAGGTGNTLPLALMAMRSKSKQLSAVGKLSIIPGWFKINEPMTFGIPIMYNPIMSIPFVLNIPVVMLCALVLYKIGFLTPGWIVITAILPMGFGSYLSTLSWRNALTDYLMLIPSALIWYPFFKVYEKQLIAKEAAVEAEEKRAAVSNQGNVPMQPVKPEKEV